MSTDNPPAATRVSIIGTGYLGATHAVCMSELGFSVVGVDIDPGKVANLAAGRVPFFEPGLEELLRKNLDTGRLTFTTSFTDAAAADVHFLCVGTPQRPDSPAADLSHLVSAVDRLLAAGPKPGSLLVGKSTVPAGTAAALARRLATEAPLVGLAWNPEFLREGFAVEDTMRPDRLVLGLQADDGGRAEGMLRAIYASAIEAGTPLVLTDFATAELVKVAANAFLATKISFINAMAEICEATGGDVKTLAAALAHDARIGGRFLGAGVGFGGGCLPKDIRAFQARAAELGAGYAVGFLAEVDAINLRRRTRMAELTTELLGGSVAGRRVAVLGAAFKPNSDDIRDSPALDVANLLHRAGAVVTVTDPAAVPNARQRHPELSYADNAVQAATDADIVLHLTEWSDFREIDPVALASYVRTPTVIDGRNALDVARWRAAGWSYYALGRPRV
ncbi:UDP-glucose/GDP-mannose dehydrogenase family protein [Frankia sp. CNm7]|uniref:UDP-glucose 6-dehydrogenase n=2 Tax=Frankia nepalensis TaxID=1836974 RepID=A0A937UQ91_9ACTN|nr:UDP-glucose/GDP-mannose dehydrogenase family protein [Frankia nepalensis]MBL7512791.1 UDP-glucose/GDP-mannose dehydrogenase family protein [Frankia nepalensis]MBL7524460.1 UDP-glucose/GDP-mannose dehydrogenase family protein [Frankia nepalensis]MBL7626416.1 UDP-glucose/GDP-mannose dehydrogenase family protein [Frankia nepalensis]